MPPRPLAVPAPERILNAALEVFAELGYTGASTREIARRAGVHQPAIAYHFGNKERLWRAAANGVFGEFSVRLRETLAQARDREERIAGVARVYVSYAAHKPAWATFIVHEGMRTGERSRWLVKTWLQPQAQLLYKAITDRDWPRRDGAEMRRAISTLSILTGSALIFLERAQIKRLSGVDTESKAFIEQHAHTVCEVLKSLRDL